MALNRLLRLRPCRLLALLACLLLAGVLPHGHANASEPAGPVMVVAAPTSGDGPDIGDTNLLHCGACHATRAVIPFPAGDGAARASTGNLLAVVLTTAPDGQIGQVPARPPRAVIPA